MLNLETVNTYDGTHDVQDADTRARHHQRKRLRLGFALACDDAAECRAETCRSHDRNRNSRECRSGDHINDIVMSGEGYRYQHYKIQDRDRNERTRWGT